jgi:site-specific recombinase XerD
LKSVDTTCIIELWHLEKGMKGCRPLSEVEKEQVVNSIVGRHQLRDRLIVLFGIYTGFRISEILSLQVKDVYQNGTVVDHVTVQRRNVKGKKEGRSIVLHQRVKDSILNYLANSSNFSPNTYLFLNQSKTQQITRQQAWNVLKKAFSSCNLTGNLATHSLRKTFAASVYERSGHCLLKTKRALGHTDIRTTEKYLSFAESEIENLITNA